MYLINTTTLKLEYFIGQCPHPYAILSHTWGSNEITFADFSTKQLEELDDPKSLYKIQHTCRQARENKIKYAWIDTCCINKESSAELSEAINSMYKWYKNAAVCYAYLADFHKTYHLDRLGDCKWFSRGWTLQELLAPKRVVFYTAEWTLLGEKATMLKELEKASGISMDVLSGAKSIDTVSVAARMSWAAKRKTTRPEDLAYCLLGIFDVNMPLLYGEGEKAFIRLQSEIMSQSQDDSLFAWRGGSSDYVITYRGLYASGPSEFVDCSDIEHFGVDTANPTTIFGNGRISMNCGLVIGEGLTLATLKCYRRDIGQVLAIAVQRIGKRTYLRAKSWALFTTSLRPFDKNILIERYARIDELHESPKILPGPCIAMGHTSSWVMIMSTYPPGLMNSTRTKISVLDILIAKKVGFHFKLPDSRPPSSYLLIFWVERRPTETEYRYLFDLVAVPAAHRVLQLEEDSPRKESIQDVSDPALMFFRHAGKPRALSNLKVGTVELRFDRRLEGGHEILYFYLYDPSDMVNVLMN